MKFQEKKKEMIAYVALVFRWNINVFLLKYDGKFSSLQSYVNKVVAVFRISFVYSTRLGTKVQLHFMQAAYSRRNPVNSHRYLNAAFLCSRSDDI